MENGSEDGEANLLLEPRSDRLALEPVRRNFRHSGEEIDNAHLRAQQPKRPRRSSRRSQFWPQPCIDRQGAMCRRENQQKAKKTNQVGVIHVPSLIEKKEVGVAQEKERGANAIKKPNG